MNSRILKKVNRTNSRKLTLWAPGLLVAIASLVTLASLVTIASPALGQERVHRIVEGDVPTPLVDSDAHGRFDPALSGAIEQYQSGQSPPRIEVGNRARYPFGHAKPVLACQPLRVSLIRLQPGEEVLTTISGDTESWAIHLASSGPGGRTPIVVVKPLTDRVQKTNLFITTDRRVYEVGLESKGQHAPDEPLASSILEFYYPDDLVRKWAEARRPPVATTSSVLDLSPKISLGDMNFTYTWKREKRFPWAPESVFDDRAHVYIKLPPEAEHGPAAALFVTGPDGRNIVLNYTVRGGMIITDRVFQEAHFVVSEPSGRKGKSKEYRLEISKTRDR